MIHRGSSQLSTVHAVTDKSRYLHADLSVPRQQVRTNTGDTFIQHILFSLIYPFDMIHNLAIYSSQTFSPCYLGHRQVSYKYVGRYLYANLSVPRQQQHRLGSCCNCVSLSCKSEPILGIHLYSRFAA